MTKQEAKDAVCAIMQATGEALDCDFACTCGDDPNIGLIHDPKVVQFIKQAIIEKCERENLPVETDWVEVYDWQWG